MPGVKGRSGGRRAGTGPKKKADLEQLHASMDEHVGSADWAAMIGALVKKAKQGDVPAFRELRACRFGHIPLATQPAPAEDEPRKPIQYIEVVRPGPCNRKHVDEVQQSWLAELHAS